MRSRREKFPCARRAWVGNAAKQIFNCCHYPAVNPGCCCCCCCRSFPQHLPPPGPSGIFSGIGFQECFPPRGRGLLEEHHLPAPHPASIRKRRWNAFSRLSHKFSLSPGLPGEGFWDEAFLELPVTCKPPAGAALCSPGPRLAEQFLNCFSKIPNKSVFPKVPWNRARCYYGNWLLLIMLITVITALLSHK